MKSLHAAIAALSVSTTIFAVNGVELTSVGTTAGAQKVLVLPSGKVAVAGTAKVSYNSFAVVQYTANGALDSSFGSGGKATTTFGNFNASLSDLALQNGKLVVTGYSIVASKNTQYTKMTSARYTSTGALDNTFGSNGKLVTSLSSTSDGGRGLAIQPDNKVVVSGYAASAADSALVRYSSNGALDATFGSGGKVLEVTGNGSAWNAALQQPDGKLVVAGALGSVMGVGRYLANGAPDTSFNGTGKMTIPGTGGFELQAIVRQSDGTYVAVGGDDVYFIDATGAILSISSFAVAGGVSVANDVAIQPDGKIVVVGNFQPSVGNHAFQLARYNSDGSVDLGFGAAGVVVHTINDASEANGVALQPDGKILATGWANTGSLHQFATARYNGADGSLDTTW